MAAVKQLSSMWCLLDSSPTWELFHTRAFGADHGPLEPLVWSALLMLSEAVAHHGTVRVWGTPGRSVFGGEGFSVWNQEVNAIYDCWLIQILPQ